MTSPRSAPGRTSEPNESEVFLTFSNFPRSDRLFVDRDNYKLRLKRFGNIWAGWDKMVDEPFWETPRCSIELDPRSIYVSLGWRWTVVGFYLFYSNEEVRHVN